MKYVYIITNPIYIQLFKNSQHFENTVILTTQELASKLRVELSNYNIIGINIPNNFNYPKLASRYIKTQLTEFIKEDFLYLDCDTILLKEPNIQIQENIGAVLDLSKFNKFTRKICELLKEEFNENISLFNSGVLYVKYNEDTINFFKMWHSQWKEQFKLTQFYQDQPALYLTLKNIGFNIEQLPEKYNKQIDSLLINNIKEDIILHIYSKIYLKYFTFINFRLKTLLTR